ncbi:MAG TPA: IPT/TIG domain-containing protein [Actinoplanes sp.]
MRKSNSSFRSRLAGAGITTGAVAAAVLVAPGAAFAAGATVPFTVVPGGTTSVIDPTPVTPFTGSSTVQIRADACSTTYATPTATIVNGTSVGQVGGTRINFTVPVAVVAGTNTAPRLYNVCVYAGSTAGVGGSALQSSSAVSVSVAPPTLNSNVGVSGGGNALTVTAAPGAPVFTGLTALGAVFTQGNCPATYGTPTANLTAADTTRTSNTAATLTVPAGVTSTTAAPTPYTICFYNGQTAASTFVTSTSYNASIVSLSNTSGSSAGGNGITVSSTTPLFAGIAAPGVLFTTAAACPTVFDDDAVTGLVPVASSAVRRLGEDRLAATVPSLPLTGSAPTAYQLCVYNGQEDDTSTLLAAATYTSATPAVPTGITPTAGPATGGTRITVTGENFPTTAGSISATLGGVPLLNITPFSSTSFFATTPRHSVENNSTLIVTTSTGTRALQNAFSFQNAITVRPNTAPNTTPAIDVEVTGTGFLSNTFGASGTTARVFLVNGVYNATDLDSTGAVRLANGPVAECSNVLTVSDELLICTLQLNRRLDATGAALFDPSAYTNLTNNAAAPTATTAAGSRIITATAGTFSINDIGQPVSGDASIPANTTIASVLSPTQAVMSASATATQSVAFNLTVGAGAVRSQAGVGTVTTNRTITAAAGSFTQADIGRVISGTGITAGTTITAVAPNGGSATLSAAATATSGGTPISVNLYAAAPVPNGAYIMTVVSNGAADAATTDSSYQQSTVSSGATFTVAPS